MKLDILQFAGQKLKIKPGAGSATNNQVWDPIRSKWVAFTPEEMVRILFIYYLIESKNISKNKIAVEKGIKAGLKNKRFDILIYDKSLNPYLAIECKSPDIKLNEVVISQLVRYNEALNCKYLCITNGSEFFIFSKKNKYWIIEEEIDTQDLWSF